MYVSITRGYRSGGYNVQMFSELIQSDMQQKMIEAILDKAPESMAGMIEGMIKQHMPNYGKELNVQETNCLQARVQLELRSGSTSQFVQRQTEDRPCRILHGYPRPTNRQICQ